ncbi:ABC transporter permease [Pseudoclavibacter sp. CFCC 13796]|uniref:ABC transporter permease n=1 Tax=Pseudoclavibacter sp. CFCC 13796 TaxID=2615179 RepID=UPI0013018E8A|nr:ABC transporter permease [Pseudoclavibacter sp. CFCC 13796]KAB1659921.1 ABC transporter permease [Pseudoclavibacter sp. CFCC 13796]
MLRTTLSTLRAHWSRLVAVAIAVVLAVAFVAATLMLNASFQQTLRNTLGSDLTNADVLVEPQPVGANDADHGDDGGDEAGAGGASAARLTVGQLHAVQHLPQVEAVGADQTASLALAHDGRSQPVSASVQLPTPLRPHALVAGAWVTGDGQMTMDAKGTDQLGLHVGDQVRFASTGGSPVEVTLVGLTETSNSPGSGMAPQVALSESSLLAALMSTMPSDVSSTPAATDDLLPMTSIRVQAKAGVSPDQVRDAVAGAISSATPAASGDTVRVRTTEQVVADQLKQFTGQTDVLTGMLLAFAVIALIVCVLVISNTFSVIVAQRTRELAMLRCLGASRGQVRGSVLLEALVMSVVASVLGVVVAALMMSGAVALSRSSGNSMLTELSVPVSSVVVGVLAGVVITLIAAWQPARSATRVAPLAALRPELAAPTKTRAGRARVIVGLVLFVAGTALQWYGWTTAHRPVSEDSAEQQLLLGLGGGVLGSALSIVGVVLLAIVIVPPLVRVIGSLLALTGVPGQMATLNASRNPRRTAATASALLIGVTLVTTVFTGASVAKATLLTAVDEARPVDVKVFLTPQSREASTDQQWIDDRVQRLAAIDDVQSVGTVQGIVVGDSVPFVGQNAPTSAQLTQLEAVDPQTWQRVAKAPLPATSPDTVTVVDEALPDGSVPGGEMSMTGPDGRTASLHLQHGMKNPYFGALVDEPTLDRVASEIGVPVTTTSIIMQLAPGLDAQAVQHVAEQIGTIMPDDYVSPAQLEKLMYEQIIDVLLSIVTGLLAIAVVIAVIGVTNTLSLSVIERVRENALLRALGLTKRQLRAMLGMESVLVSIVATTIGLVLGTAYGLLGVGILFGQTIGTGVEISWQLPWVQYLLFVVIAVMVGLLASVLPARRAARLSPVQGLASE